MSERERVDEDRIGIRGARAVQLRASKIQASFQFHVGDGWWSWRSNKEGISRAVLKGKEQSWQRHYPIWVVGGRSGILAEGAREASAAAIAARPKSVACDDCRVCTRRGW
jgi:hypothetical protein